MTEGVNGETHAHPQGATMEAVRADPAQTLRRAWSEFSLPQLEQLVVETIRLLGAVEPVHVLGRPVDDRETNPSEGPVVEALEACCAELREECGMHDASLQRSSHGQLVRRLMADRPQWTATFREALTKYRSLAAALLDTAFREASRAAPNPVAEVRDALD